MVVIWAALLGDQGQLQNNAAKVTALDLKHFSLAREPFRSDNHPQKKETVCLSVPPLLVSICTDCLGWHFQTTLCFWSS